MISKITIFGAPWCAPCKALKLKLDSKGVEYEYNDVENPDNVDLLTTLLGAPPRNVPVVFRDGVLLSSAEVSSL